MSKENKPKSQSSGLNNAFPLNFFASSGRKLSACSKLASTELSDYTLDMYPLLPHAILLMENLPFAISP
ncbi:MAG: hypothetical protein ACK2U5_07205 [Candidatus Promineifilaceae bacterium]|jgi:hypothetical protein